MHFTVGLAVALVGFGPVLAHPRRHHHEKRVDYNDPATYGCETMDYCIWTPGYVKGGKAESAAPQESPAEHTDLQETKKAAPKFSQKNAVDDSDSGSTQKTPKKTPPKDDTPTQSSSSPSGGKRGLAYNYESPKDASIYSGLSKLSWCHNWDSKDFDNICGDRDFVPTLRTMGDVGGWDAGVKESLASGSTHLMAFNEPDVEGLDPKSTADAYRTHMAKHGSNSVKLGSPSVTSDVSPGKGLSWLESFLGECADCQIDFIQVHWYGCETLCPVEDDLAALKKHVKGAVALANGKPVWVPEIMTLGPAKYDAGDAARSEAFLPEAMKFLDSEPGVERYAYFMYKDTYMVQGGSVNEIGKMFGA